MYINICSTIAVYKHCNSSKQFCNDKRNFQSFVHVSTAYANCPLDLIEEKVYEAPIDGEKLITIVEYMDEKLIDEITPR